MTKARNLADFISDATVATAEIENSAVTTDKLADDAVTAAKLDETETYTTAGLTVNGNIAATGTVDGRDVAADGTKLDGIEASADVTDTTNVTAAGAAMETGADFTGNVTFGDNNKAIFGAGSDLQIYSDGTNSWIEEHGGGDLYIEATNLTLRALDNTVYATFTDSGAATINHAGAQKFTTTSTGVDITGVLSSDGLTVDGSVTITDTSGIGLGAATPAQFGSGVPTIAFQGTADNGRAGALNFREYAASGDGAITSQIYSTDGSDGYGFVLNAQQGSLKLNAGGLTATKLEVKTSGVVINEVGADNDFRVESDGLTHALFVDAGNNNIGLGKSNPSSSYRLDVNGNMRLTGGAGTIRLEADDGSLSEDQLVGRVEMYANDASTGGTGVAGYIEVKSDDQYGVNTYMSLGTRISDGSGNATERLKITKQGGLIQYATTDGGVTLNESGADADFRVESDNNAYALFVDAGSNSVAMGTSAPSSYVNSGGLAVKGSTYSDLALVSSSVASGSNSHQMRYFNEAGASYEIARTRVNVGAGQVNRGEYQFAVNNGAGLRPWLDVNYAGDVVFNQQGYDSDFRVESDSNTHALFVDAGGDAVVFGGNGYPNVNSSSPRVWDAVATNGIAIGNGTFTHGFIGTGGTDGNVEIVSNSYPANVGANKTVFIKSGTAGGGGPAEIASFNAGGIVFNEESGDRDFRVESNARSHMLFVDASGDIVHFNRTSFSETSSGVSIRDDGLLQVTRSGGDPLSLRRTTSAGQIIAMRYGTGSGVVGSINIDSGGVTYNTTSDRRLKDNIEPIADGTEKLMAMKPVTHTWKADPEADAVHGFIAQEMQEIVPEAVSGDPDGEEMMSMDYGRITPVLVAALQEATNEIKALKQRVSELEAK